MAVKSGIFTKMAKLMIFANIVNVMWIQHVPYNRMTFAESAPDLFSISFEE